MTTDPCSRKRRFATRAEAKYQARKYPANPAHAYKCESCGFFHLGRHHGIQSREAHRDIHGWGDGVNRDYVSLAAAREILRVSEDVMNRIVESGRFRITALGIHQDDLKRLRAATYRD